MAYLRDTVVILRCDPYREHDAWVTMYGRMHGKLVAVARGLRRPNAKQAGHLEPFACVEVMIAKGSSFDKLAVARTVRPNVARSDLPSLAVCGAFCHTFERLTRPGVADPALYDLLVDVERALVGLPATVSSERLTLLYAGALLKLLDRLGFGPDFDQEPADLRKVLRLMRFGTFDDLLRLTAPVPLFQAASQRVQDASAAAPLDREPHGPATIARLLASQFLEG